VCPNFTVLLFDTQQHEFLCSLNCLLCMSVYVYVYVSLSLCGGLILSGGVFVCADIAHEHQAVGGSVG